MQWRPISLLFKNNLSEGDNFYEPAKVTHGLLRVMEAASAGAATPEAGNEAIFRLYRQAGTWIHQDGKVDFTPADLLDAVGLDTSFASAFDDEAWDSVIREKMDDGLSLVGQDVGTPIIAIERSDGTRAGYFGPVINKLPEPAKGVAMWDGLVAMMEVDSFFELKRTRTGGLDFGTRPEL